MTIGPVRISPFGPLAALAAEIKCRHGEDDTTSDKTSGPAGALRPKGPQPASPPIPVTGQSLKRRQTGKTNQEVSMVHKFIIEHAWKFPSTPPADHEVGIEGTIGELSGVIPGVSGGIPIHEPRLSS